jgi:hypothetical protein
MAYMYIEKRNTGYKIYTYDNNFPAYESKRGAVYIGYSLRDAIRKWRVDFGYCGKRFEKIMF